jgi:hypothetical protein
MVCVIILKSFGKFFQFFFVHFSSQYEIVQSLLNVENQELGLENLEGMLKILPDINEVILS